MIIANSHVKIEISVKIKSSGVPVNWAIRLLHWIFGALFIYLFIFFVQLRSRLACEVQLITREGRNFTKSKETEIQLNCNSIRKESSLNLLGLVTDLGLQVSPKNVESSCDSSRTVRVALLEKRKSQVLLNFWISEYRNHGEVGKIWWGESNDVIVSIEDYGQQNRNLIKKKRKKVVTLHKKSRLSNWSVSVNLTVVWYTRWL
jgi:hypothetical protein